MRLFLLIVILTLNLISCGSESHKNSAIKNEALINYANPFIGTGGHGHTFPGATMPFGMMQLSPDTRLDGWDGCSGYHYSDNYIYGFSHTHLSGTGVSDYGDILLMPTNTISFNNGSDGKPGYRAHFSHDNEIAEPGYYRVLLDSTNIEVELTVSKRSGIHQYKYPSAEHQFLVLDLEHRDALLDYKIQMLKDETITGFRYSKAWAKDQRLYYHIQFSHPIKDVTYLENGTPISKNYKFVSTQAVIEFDNPKNDPVLIKIGISPVDEAGARQNLVQEIGDKSFNEIKREAQSSWERQLEKIIIESPNEDYKTNFYTSLYHTMIAPNIYQDVDGRYRGMDLEIHETNNFEYYTVFSLWDTYRATHPLYTIIEQQRTNDFINTFLAKYDEGGIMPIWDLSANYTGCMIGYHAVPVIADAYLKGIQDYDIVKAFEAMKHSATRDKLGLSSYKAYGFIPLENESESVSKTLEYAYDDWSIAQMAKAMNNQEDYKVFIKRAQNYKNIFDPDSKFMRGRFRNTWFSPFDPNEVNFNYTEANAWQYSFYVPQDISGLIDLHGGKENLEEKLDDLFSAESKTSGRHQADITGLIGQYAHGNEPSHHMAYLYNFVNKPHKTQEKVHEILTELYRNSPDGISGNEDCGQMSAWYVFSSLGFYPVTPGNKDYIIGTPLFDKATINLENGNQFHIVAHELNEKNIYIESVVLNGEPYNQTYITHEVIMTGGSLEFQMTNQPTDWGTFEGEQPITSIDEYRIVPAPFIAEGDVAFKGQTEVKLDVIQSDLKIYYSLDHSDFKLYSEPPFTISKASSLKAYAIDDHGNRSATLETKFYKINPNVSISLDTEYANQYNAGGNDALIDGIMGTSDFRTGTWQGYWDQDIVATVNLGKITPFKTVSINFLEDQRSWIFLPNSVEILYSVNGKNFKTIKKVNLENTKPNDNAQIHTVSFEIPTYHKIQYIKIIAKKMGELPEWHLGHQYDGRSWIFADEISIK